MLNLARLFCRKRRRSPKSPATGERKNKRGGSSKVSPLNASQGNGAGRPNNTSACGSGIKDTKSEEREIAPSPPRQGAEITGGYFNVICSNPNAIEYVVPNNLAIVDKLISEGFKPPPCSSDLEDGNGSAYQDMCDVLYEYFPFDRTRAGNKERPPSPKWIPYNEITDFSKIRIHPDGIC